MNMTTLTPPRTQTQYALETRVGTLVLSGTDDALRELLLPGTAGPGELIASRDLSDAPQAVADACAQLTEYFNEIRTSFDLPLETTGTPFQRHVWKTLAEIPYGHTITYAQLARMVGRPSAFRAVGQANGANPIPIILPCHRVLASGGGLGGFGGGLELKRTLLTHEGVLCA
jgi:methylated-DNA-[protein]-cysteine S-methyltransferase